jgi:hypothetical protein
VINYHIEASDGGIGHVENLLIDEDTWAIRYMIVDTSNWWLGHQVLVAPQWIREVRGFDNTAAVDATRQTVKAAPSYDAAMPLSRDQEMDLYGLMAAPATGPRKGSARTGNFPSGPPPHKPTSIGRVAPPGTIDRREDEPDPPGRESIGWSS